MTDSRFLVPFVLYLVILYVWRENVFNGMGLNISGDRVASMSLKRIVANWLEQGVFPFWNPYFYGGVAMFESFQSSWLFNPMLWIVEGPFPDPSQPGFFNGGLGWLLFFNSPVDIILFHHLLGAVGVAFLVRHLGGKGWAQFIAGLLFLLSPQLVVLGDVGHGSKLFAMCWLPWVLLTLDRALDKPGLLRIALMCAAFGMMMYAQHIQVAYYGYMMAGFWWLARSLVNLKDKNLKRIPVDTGIFAIGGIAGLFTTAVIYFNTLSYSKDSIRGVKGVTWDYATSWSFHPQESLAMFVPDFFGFGGKTYWGYLPFTDMPLYWGIPATVLALVALFTIRGWRIGTFFVLGLLAWVTSFGKFMPVLYRLFFDYLPYFNKFRVPMMIHILVLLCALALAGLGMQKVLEIRASDEATVKKWRKWIISLVTISGVMLLVALAMKSSITTGIEEWIQAIKPAKASTSTLLAENAAVSISRSILFAHLSLVAILITLSKRIPSWTFGIIITGLILFDLVPLSERLLHPVPNTRIDKYFQSNETIEYLQQAPRSRLLPTDNTRPVNTWAAFGLELQGGYTGSKPAAYGYLQDKKALTHPNVMSVMGVRYIHSSRQIQGLPELFRGEGEYIYEYPAALPRAFLRNKWKIIEDTEEALEYLTSEEFEPSMSVILDRNPEGITPGEDAEGSAAIIDWDANQTALSVISDKPSLLVLSESYTSSGWKATINGAKVDILRANGIFKAIVVPEGSSEVLFRYRPAHWIPSIIVSILTWLLIIGMGVTGYMRNRRNLSD